MSPDPSLEQPYKDPPALATREHPPGGALALSGFSDSENVAGDPPLQRQRPPPAISDLEVNEAYDAFASLAGEMGLPVPRALTPERRRKLRARLAEFGREAFAEALAKIRASDFCQGGGANGWRIDLDSFLQPKTFRNLMEGRYDGGARGDRIRHENRMGIAAAVAARRREHNLN